MDNIKYISNVSENFKWEGTGQQIFSANKSVNNDSTDNDHEKAAGGEEEYDPHYEPIVPLPDEIKVTTGEEDEVTRNFNAF